MNEVRVNMCLCAPDTANARCGFSTGFGYTEVQVVKGREELVKYAVAIYPKCFVGGKQNGFFGRWVAATRESYSKTFYRMALSYAYLDAMAQATLKIHEVRGNIATLSRQMRYEVDEPVLDWDFAQAYKSVVKEANVLLSKVNHSQILNPQATYVAGEYTSETAAVAVNEVLSTASSEYSHVMKLGSEVIIMLEQASKQAINKQQ